MHAKPWRWAFLLLLLALTACSFTASLNQPPAATATAGAAQASGAEQANRQGEVNPLDTIPYAAETERVLAAIVQYLTFFAELCGALVIAVAVVRGIIRFVPHIVRETGADDTYKEDIRLQLGKSLALALEFELGADILKTAVAPSFTIIAQLAAIIVLRTALNYFLERELRQTEQRRAGLHQKVSPAEAAPKVPQA
jgi:uncharacterized membrane protein